MTEQRSSKTRIRICAVLPYIILFSKKEIEMAEKENIVVDKSKRFALKTIRMYKYLCSEQKEYILSKQVLRSGTSIGANIAEAVRGRSKPDFYSKLNIALQEASETAYWLDLLYESDYLNDAGYKIMSEDCEELIRILTSITKTQNADS